MRILSSSSFRQALLAALVVWGIGAAGLVTLERLASTDETESSDSD